MVGSTSRAIIMHGVVDDNSNSYRNMVMDAMRMNQSHDGQCPIVDEEPNADVARFFFISFERLWWTIMDDCTNHSKLSIVAQVFTIKSDHGLSEDSYNRIVK